MKDTLQVLVVDDENMITRVVKAILTKWGIPADNIICAHSLPEALEIISSRSDLDLLICDYNIPKGNEGGEIMDAAKKKSKATHVISITGAPGNIPDIRERHRPDFVLEKPFGMDTLLKAVEECAQAITGVVVTTTQESAA
ncbi:MAG: response regulator [Patescibacteria group bacterium]